MRRCNGKTIQKPSKFEKINSRNEEIADVCLIKKLHDSEVEDMYRLY